MTKLPRPYLRLSPKAYKYIHAGIPTDVTGLSPSESAALEQQRLLEAKLQAEALDRLSTQLLPAEGDSTMKAQPPQSKPVPPGNKTYARFVSDHMIVTSGRVDIGMIENEIYTCGKTFLYIPPVFSLAFHSLSLSATLSALLYMERGLVGYDPSRKSWGPAFIVKYEDLRTAIRMPSIPMCMKRLQLLSIIDTKRIGLPAMQHVRIDHDALIALILELCLSKGADPLG